VGAIHLGPPLALVQDLAKAGDYRLFIETGTWKAGTALWAAQHFERVITIEADDNRYRLAKERYGDRANVRWVNGDSAVYLRWALQSMNEAAIFWLDAHHPWGNTDRPGLTECPLLAELAAIHDHSLRDYHTILVDDARLFNAPPGKPWTPGLWPTRQQVEKILPATHAIYEVEDVIVAVPTALSAVVLHYTQ